MVDFTKGFGPLSALGQQPKTQFETDPMSSYQAPTIAAEEEAAPEEDSTAALYRKARETLLASRNTGMDPLTTFLLAASQAGPGGIGGAISRGGIAAQQVMAESAKSDQARQLKLLELGIEEGKYKDTLAEKSQIAREKFQNDLIIAREKADAAAERAAEKKQDAAERAAAVEESRYWNRYQARARDYATTGVWTPEPLDSKFGIDKPPSVTAEEPTPDNPLVKTAPLKIRNKLIENFPTAKNAANVTMENFEKLKETALKIKEHKGLPMATGLMGSLLEDKPITQAAVSKLSGTDAADAFALMENLKSVLFVDTLNGMRAMSKTGGAVGNVSNKEGERLVNLRAALSNAQTEKQYKQAMDDIVDYVINASESMKDAYETTYGSDSIEWKKKPWEPFEVSEGDKKPKTIVVDY